jgi:hypothetical protein
MFDLDSSIRAWRREAASKLAGGRASVAELEDHLREEFAALVQAGHSGDEAWKLATSKLGDAATLGREFAKVDRLSRLDRLVLGSMTGATAMAIALFMAVVALRRPDRPNDPVLAVHVMTITLAYLVGLLAAAVAGYATVRASLASAPLPALQAAMRRLVRAASVVAAIFTVLGFALGAVWASRAWGRAFNADPKEFGAILVALTFGAAAFTAWRAEAPSRLSQTIAIIGGGCVLAAWFGANAWMNNYPPAMTAVGLGGFVVSLALATLTLTLRENDELHA